VDVGVGGGEWMQGITRGIMTTIINYDDDIYGNNDDNNDDDINDKTMRIHGTPTFLFSHIAVYERASIEYISFFL
jgi:hypothetical protein